MISLRKQAKLLDLKNDQDWERRHQAKKRESEKKKTSVWCGKSGGSDSVVVSAQREELLRKPLKEVRRNFTQKKLNGRRALDDLLAEQRERTDSGSVGNYLPFVPNFPRETVSVQRMILRAK